MAKRSPPRPHISGMTTAAARPAATAASTAFPPRASAATPAEATSGCAAAAMPRRPGTGRKRLLGHGGRVLGKPSRSPLMPVALARKLTMASRLRRTRRSIGGVKAASALGDENAAGTGRSGVDRTVHAIDPNPARTGGARFQPVGDAAKAHAAGAG